jgi:CBS domain-containing protein
MVTPRVTPRFDTSQVAADLMLRAPKTLPGDASVGEVRAQLANPRVQMVLLAEHGKLVGVFTALPAAAGENEPARNYADANPETISPSAPAQSAFRQAAASPHRRVVVVDDDGGLLGLLCLDASRTRFCQTPGSTGA